VTASTEQLSTLDRPKILTPAHDRSGFVCRHQELTDWLRAWALSNQATGANRTNVVAKHGTVIGYGTPAPASVDPAITPGSLRRNPPRPIPAARPCRLAVHRDQVGWEPDRSEANRLLTPTPRRSAWRPTPRPRAC